MAKKKRNRPAAGGRPGSATKTAAPGAAARETLPRVAPAEPGGPNRAIRKEEARRQREAIQRRMARRRTYRILAAVLAVLLAAGAVAVYELTRPSAFVAAECSPTRLTHAFTRSLSDRAHVGATNRPALSAYPTQPPASGPHDQTPLDAGIYDTPPDPYRAIHSLEHGAVIVWYQAGLSSSALQKIRDFYRLPANSDHVIVAPYNYPQQGSAGQLPAGKDMVLVAWHRYQECGDPTLAVVQTFVKSYRTPTGITKPIGYKGSAPEAGLQI
jgi:hypothetical protein